MDEDMYQLYDLSVATQWNLYLLTPPYNRQEDANCKPLCSGQLWIRHKRCFHNEIFNPMAYCRLGNFCCFTIRKFSHMLALIQQIFFIFNTKILQSRLIKS